MKKNVRKTWSVILVNRKDESNKIELLYRAYNRREMLQKVERDRVDSMRLVSAKIVK